MDVCGIDPGLGATGYAVIRAEGSCFSILDAGVITTSAALQLADRLVELRAGFREVLDQWQPSQVAIEQLYSHYNHPRTAVQMAHARGVLLVEARESGATLRDFSATHIKRFLTGNGRASKEQVQRSVQALFGLDRPPEPADVADAIAAAYCCAHREGSATMEKVI